MTYDYPDENGKFGEFGGRFFSPDLGGYHHQNYQL